MAEPSAALTKGKSWSRISADSLPAPSATPGSRSELEEQANQSSRDIRSLEDEIQNLSTNLERLKQQEVQGVQRYGIEGEALAHDKKPERAEDKDASALSNSGEGEKSVIPSQDEDKLKNLEGTHGVAQDEIHEIQVALDRKQAELRLLSNRRKALTDQLTTQQQGQLQDESSQQSAKVQNEMRSLKEEIGRLGHLMEGLTDSSAEQQKQSFARAHQQQQRQRVFYPVTRQRSRNRAINYQNGGSNSIGSPGEISGSFLRTNSADLESRSPSSGSTVGLIRTQTTPQPSLHGDPTIDDGSTNKSGSKGANEPPEFEARPGAADRKRRKNTTFEAELREQERGSKSVEDGSGSSSSNTKEKKRPIASVAGFPSRVTSRNGGDSRSGGTTGTATNTTTAPPPRNPGVGSFPAWIPPIMTTTPASRPILSPSSPSTFASADLRDGDGQQQQEQDQQQQQLQLIRPPSSVAVGGAGVEPPVFSFESLHHPVGREESGRNGSSSSDRFVSKLSSSGSSSGSPEVSSALTEREGGEGLGGEPLSEAEALFAAKVAASSGTVSAMEREMERDLDAREREGEEVLSRASSSSSTKNDDGKTGGGAGDLAPGLGASSAGRSSASEVSAESSAGTNTGGAAAADVAVDDGNDDEVVTSGTVASNEAGEEGEDGAREDVDGMSGGYQQEQRQGSENEAEATEAVDVEKRVDEGDVSADSPMPSVESPGEENGTEEKIGRPSVESEIDDGEVRGGQPEGESSGESVGMAEVSDVPEVASPSERNGGIGFHDMNSIQEAASAPDIRNGLDESLGSDVSGNISFEGPDSNEPPSMGRETEDFENASVIDDGRDNIAETHVLDQDIFIFAGADEVEDKLHAKEGAFAADMKESEKEMLEFIAGIGESEVPDDVRVQQILEAAAAVLAERPLHEDKFVSSECDSTVLLENCLARENGVAEGEIVITEISQEVIEEESAEVTKPPGSEDSDDRRDWKSLAENQMFQLSSQLSLLQKQVEEEVELHDKAKGGFDGLPPLADKEELYKQVSMFAVEVRGLRQNIEEIQHILHREGGDLSEVEHWARDLQSKCADQSAHLEHLGKQVSALSRDLKGHLEFRDDIDGKLEERAHDVQKAEDHLADLSKVLARTFTTIEREDAEIVAQHKDLLLEQLREAEKLRNIAEVKVGTLNKQIEQMQLVCEVAQSIQLVSKHQNKAVKYGLQTLFQFFLLVLGVITLYSRFAQPLRGSIIPT